MHLPTGPTAVYHHLPSSPPQSDWNSNIMQSTKSNSANVDSTQQHSTSGTTSPLGSSGSSQDLWWTERLYLEAQNEFPGELGKSNFKTTIK